VLHLNRDLMLSILIVLLEVPEAGFLLIDTVLTLDGDEV